VYWWTIPAGSSAIISPVGVSAGVGFAIPSAVVQKVVPVLIQTGHYEHPWLGMSVTSLTPELAKTVGHKPEQRGALVADVVPGGPADRAGVRGSAERVVINGHRRPAGGDVITAVDGQPVTRMEDLQTLVQLADPGQQVMLTLMREGHEVPVEVRLGERQATKC
jgi:serine protease Do